MNTNIDRTKAILATERGFWEMISDFREVSEDVLLYTPKDGCILREAHKIVATTHEGVNALLHEHRPGLLRFSPNFGNEEPKNDIRRLSQGQLSKTIGNIVYKPYCDACVYLCADNLTLTEKTIPGDVAVNVHESGDVLDEVLALRESKDSEGNEDVQRALADWVRARTRKPNARTLLVLKSGKPAGMMSFYEENIDGVQLTRVRDTFVSSEHRRCGLAGLLFRSLHEHAKPPYAVVADIGNTQALRTYWRFGFVGVFVQEAFQLVQYQEPIHGTTTS